MPFVIDGRSPTFAVARGACSYQCLKQGQWSHRHNRTNCIHDPAAAHFCACCVPCTAPLPRQRVVFFRGRGRGRGRGHGRGVAVAVAGPWLCRVCRWWLGVRMSGCPGGRVAGWVAGWPRPWRLFSIRLHTKQLVFSCISGNLPIDISAIYTRRPGAKQQACAAKEEQVA